MEGSGKVAVDPDDLVFHNSSFDHLEEADDEDIYAVAEWGADGKPRYLLSKIHNFLYTASNDVRRADNGQNVLSGMAKERVKSEDPIKAWVTPSTRAPSSSNSTASGGLRKRIAAAIQAMQRYRKALRSCIIFRELRDDESCAPSKTTSKSSKSSN